MQKLMNLFAHFRKTPVPAQLELDYRTQPVAEAVNRRFTNYAFLAISLLGIGITLLLRFAGLFVTQSIFPALFTMIGVGGALWTYLSYKAVQRRLTDEERQVFDAVGTVALTEPRWLAAAWLCSGPAICAVVWLTQTLWVSPQRTQWFYFGVIAALIFVADRIATHYVMWANANPRLAHLTRKAWRMRWQLRFAAFSNYTRMKKAYARAGRLFEKGNEKAAQKALLMAGEYRHLLLYPVGMLAVLGFNLIGFQVAQGAEGAAGSPLFAGMVGIGLSNVALLLFTLLSCGFPKGVQLRVFLSAFVNWFTYNRHYTNAPGVFQSPQGTWMTRLLLTGITLLCLSLAMLPMAYYFPVGMLLSGPEPWQEAGKKISLSAFAKKVSVEVPADNAKKIVENLQLYLKEGLKVFKTGTTPTPVPVDGWPEMEGINTLPVPNLSGNGPDTNRLPLQGQSHFQSEQIPTVSPFPVPTPKRVKAKPTSKAKEASTQQPPAATTNEVRAASTEQFLREINAAPETWLWIAIQGAFKARPLFIWSLLLSFLGCLLMPLGVMFITIFAVCARGCTLSYEVLEAEGAPRQESFATEWEAYVQRLMNSAYDKEREYLWQGINPEQDCPVLLHRPILHEHGRLHGDAGSGKSALGLAPLQSQLIRRGDASVIILDLKGDPALFHNARIEAEQAGLPFKWFTTSVGRSTYAFNPFLQMGLNHMTVEQRAQTLAKAMGLDYGEGFGESFFTQANLDALTRLLKTNPQVKSFRELTQVVNTLGNVDRDTASALFRKIQLLSYCEPLNVTPREAATATVCQNAIEMMDVVAKPQVVYLYLPVLQGATTGIEISKLALYALANSAELFQQEKGKVNQVYLFIDEFQQIVSQDLQTVFQQARSKGIATIIANQTIQDLKTKNCDLIPTVTANTRFSQIFAATDLNQLKMLVEMSGEKRILTTSWQVDKTKFEEGRQGLENAEGETISLTGQFSPRLRINDIVAASNHPLRSIVHISRGSGFSEFGGFSMIVESQFHISPSEYQRRMALPWPAGNPDTIVSQEIRTEPEGEQPFVPQRADWKPENVQQFFSLLETKSTGRIK